MYNFLSEIFLSDGEFSENKKFEILTTAKQTDIRYGDFEYTKEDLEGMAKNFNEDILGIELPVDLNHEPNHIAYAWIKPGSMEVKESTKLKGQYSLYCELHRYTEEGKDLIKNGKVRYFSVQIQAEFNKFIDKTKKKYKNVIRALALTNMPVIKDMAPTYSDNILINNFSKMDKEQLEKQLSESQATLSEKERILAEKEQENKRLSEELKKFSEEKRESELKEGVEKLMLSENKNIGFKGGEKEKVLEFVKLLSDEQAKKYFEIHNDIITACDFSEKGASEKNNGSVDYNDILEKKAKELSQKENISIAKAYERVLNEDKELAKKVY